MMHRIVIPAVLLLMAHISSNAADTLKITTFRNLGSAVVTMPFQTDTLGPDGKAFDVSSLLESPVAICGRSSADCDGTVDAQAGNGTHAIQLLGFSAITMDYAEVDVTVGDAGKNVLSVDGKKASSPLKLEPGTHDFVLKVLSDTSVTPTVSLISGKALEISTDGRRIYSLDLNTQGAGCSWAGISAGGNLAALTLSNISAEGKNSRYTEIVRLDDGAVIESGVTMLGWMPEGDSYYYTRPTVSGMELVTRNPLTGSSSVICRDLPKGQFSIVPGGRYLIFSLVHEAPKEGDVHEILTPDDRQPGWRDRGYLARLDLRTGIMQPITFGYHNAWLTDISADGSTLLFMSTRERLSARPTTLYSLYRMDIATLETECVVDGDGFINNGILSPDGSRIAVTGSPEAFGGIGSTVPEGRIPNMYDCQLFLLDKGKVTPLTRKFDPGVDKVLWSREDGCIYFSAETKDCKKLYRCNPDRGKITALGDIEDNESDFDLAAAPVLLYKGQSLENGERVYTMDTRNLKSSLLRDICASRFEGVEFGKGGAFEFKSSKGDMINCFYVLPPDFDPAEKYPMLVHYYGGCSPSARYCVGSYSPQYYAAQGYVFLVINPSGASGFGQEFASRHVNTAGDGVAEDIIEATQRFCDGHQFVDRKHIGCFSASYGGFMTQLLLAKTDIFATGISHAGISDHTSYWGEGYWGYSYSEVSMAGSYPWTRKDLYVDRSPLYNADKIHTPLLFLHGSADTNVPIGESIQMFTALKLLGQDTAFVVVDGENHGIRDYAKRRQWLRTISAWFAKYLKEDDSWWNELYPEKTL